MKLPNIFAKDTAPVFYPAGSTIFEIGQPRDAMFIVQEGEVEIKVGNFHASNFSRYRQTCTRAKADSDHAEIRTGMLR